MAKARQAKVIQGDIFGQHQVTDRVIDIRLLLAPLAIESVGTVRLLGLNYANHAKEASRSGIYREGELLMSSRPILIYQSTRFSLYVPRCLEANRHDHGRTDLVVVQTTHRTCRANGPGCCIGHGTGGAWTGL
jgi:hypothetical protein